MTQYLDKHAFKFTIKLFQENDNSNDRPTGADSRELRCSDRSFRRKAPKIFFRVPCKFVLSPLVAPLSEIWGHVSPPAQYGACAYGSCCTWTDKMPEKWCKSGTSTNTDPHDKSPPDPPRFRRLWSDSKTGRLWPVHGRKLRRSGGQNQIAIPFI